MQKKKWLPAALHIMAWTLFLAIPQFMRPDPRPRHHPGPPTSPHDAPYMPQHHSDGFWLYFSILQNILLIPLFYLNTQYIFPKLLPRKKYGMLVLVQMGLALVQFGYNKLLRWLFFPQMHMGPGGSISVFVYLVVLSVAYGYYLSREAARIEKTQNETLKAELQFLRWQVSPHFLFNALNNMVALARKRSELLEPMLIDLSGIMRYMLYETDEAKVSLKKEAHYLQSYVSLQGMRYDNIKIDVDINIPDDVDHHIEPMLLIPFVENAFKHGVDLIDRPEISISLSVENDELHFTVANKIAATQTQKRDDAHGIGLANVRKRLSLLYAGRHTLQMEINEKVTVSLKIKLHHVTMYSHR